MTRRMAAVAIIATALMGLTACTAGSADAGPFPTSSDAPGDEGQSVADACAVVQQTITDATEEFEAAAETDPAAVVEAMKAAAGTLASAGGQVTNDAVAALLPELQQMFHAAADVMQGIVEGDASKLDDLAALGETFQSTGRRFEDLCTS